ncbi:MAG: hypothetical protein H6546_02865 [Chitinophagales bacterium]|nr:hypothetical protein [Chitinophagales bacterium]
MNPNATPTTQPTKTVPNIRYRDRLSSVGVPYRLITDESGYGGAFLHPAISNMTLSYGRTRKDIEQNLRVRLYAALDFYQGWYDIGRKRALFIGDRQTTGWWFTIVGVGMGYTRTGIMSWYKRFNFIFMWGEEIQRLKTSPKRVWKWFTHLVKKN